MPNKQQEPKQPSKQPGRQPAKKIEGEGSYEGTRRYNEHVKDFAQSGKVKKAADEAKDAVEGKEREALEQAEEAGKKGPKH